LTKTGETRSVTKKHVTAALVYTHVVHNTSNLGTPPHMLCFFDINFAPKMAEGPEKGLPEKPIHLLKPKAAPVASTSAAISASDSDSAESELDE
jgi:hypothetical protein